MKSLCRKGTGCEVRDTETNIEGRTFLEKKKMYSDSIFFILTRAKPSSKASRYYYNIVDRY